VRFKFVFYIPRNLSISFGKGGMHYVGYAPLAAAVSNAGGIGVVTALTQPNAEALQLEIQKTRSLLRSPDIPIG